MAPCVPTSDQYSSKDCRTTQSLKPLLVCIDTYVVIATMKICLCKCHETATTSLVHNAKEPLPVSPTAYNSCSFFFIPKSLSGARSLYLLKRILFQYSHAARLVRERAFNVIGSDYFSHLFGRNRKFRVASVYISITNELFERSCQLEGYSIVLISLFRYPTQSFTSHTRAVPHPINPH